MAYRLKVVAGPGMGTECDLEDSEITIGRAPENGMVINDNNVSRVHAKFTLAPGNRVVVADNDSRNGVYVNDRKVKQQPLNPGDRVVIGQTVIELIGEGTKGGARAPAGGTNGRQAAPASAPARRPNGNGSAVAKQVAPMARTSTQKPARPNSPGAKADAAKAKGGLPLPAIAIAVVAVFLGVAFVMSQGGPKPGEIIANNGTPRPQVTPPLFPGQTPGNIVLPSNGIEKLPKDAQQWIDIGDSQRQSNNLVQARTSYRNSIKIVPNCESCNVRLTAVDRLIEDKITSYEKSGTQAYEAGDFLRAIDSWEIAISYMGDPKIPRAAQLKQRIADAKTQIKQQPQ